MKFLAQPTPHAEALTFLRGLPAVDRDTFDAMLPEFQHAAFLITGIWQHDVLQDVQDIVAGAHSGENWDEVRARITRVLEPHLGGQAKRRALMILRANVYRTSAAGVVRQLDNHRAAFPFRKRLSAGDGRVRDSHRAMHGMVLPADSPFWDSHTPPDAHNCRCQVVAVTRGQAARLAAQEDADVAAGTMRQEERRVATGALAKQQEAGVINRGLNEQWNLNKEPGTVAWSPRSLYLPMEQIKARYTPEVFAHFAEWAKQQRPDGVRTLWEALTEQREGLPDVKVKPIQPALPLPGPLPPPRTREQVLAAISPDMTGVLRPPVPQPAPQPAPPPVPSPAAAAPAPAAPAAPAPQKGTRESIAAAKYVSKKPMNSQGVNGSHLLKNGEKVVFKPAAEEDPRPLRRTVPVGTQHRREVAASLVAEALGVKLVPPTAMITHAGDTGSAMLFRDGYVTAAQYLKLHGRDPAKAVPKKMLEQWQLFDDVVNHLDRHWGNWMLGADATGKVLDVALIDNGLSLPHSPSGEGWGRGKRFPVGLEGQPLSRAGRAALQSLLTNEQQLRAELTGLLEPAAVDLLFARVRLLHTRGTYGDAI